MWTPVALYFLSIALTISISGFGVAIANGIAVNGMFDAINRQISARSTIQQTLLIGLLLIEGSFILSFLVCLYGLLAPSFQLTWGTVIAWTGGAVSVGVAACCVALAAGTAVSSACKAIARSPFSARKIQMFSLIILTLIETAVFFAFVVWILIAIRVPDILDYQEGVKVFAGGLAIGLGAIGPAIGQLLFSKQACYSVGLNKGAYGKIFTLSMLTEALIETPVLFSFVVALTLIFKEISPVVTPSGSLVFVAAAFAVGVGTLGAAVGVGFVGGRGVKQTALSEGVARELFSMTLLSQALIETGGLFSLLVALFIIMKVTI